jgi:hypothetical protein
MVSGAPWNKYAFGETAFNALSSDSSIWCRLSHQAGSCECIGNARTSGNKTTWWNRHCRGLSKGTGRFVLGNANTKLVTDGRLACLVTNHFLCEGFAEMALEMVQLSMSHHLTRLCT